MRKRKRVFRIACFGLFSLLLSSFLYFPGQQFPVAFVLLTGIGKPWLQAKIDLYEEKAIDGSSFDKSDIKFLTDLYTCLYKGARLTLVLPQVTRMMRHYLGKTGSPLEIDPAIFNTNRKVIDEMDRIRNAVKQQPGSLHRFESGTFYMPDQSNIDSVFGLYYGKLIADPAIIEGKVHIKWRAEVPWEWPSYGSLKKEYGDAHAESFPIPNVSCLALGPKGAIFIDNGLGEYLTKLGIAKSYLAFSEWREVLR